MGAIRYQHCGKKILKTTPQRHDELHEKMSCMKKMSRMKNELHELASRISRETKLHEQANFCHPFASSNVNKKKRKKNKYPSEISFQQHKILRNCIFSKICEIGIASAAIPCMI